MSDWPPLDPRVIDGALDLLQKPGGWTQGAMHINGAYCMHGAIRAQTSLIGDAAMWSTLISRLGYTLGWNDSKGRTLDEVVSVLHEIYSTSESDMVSHFGPNWKGLRDFFRLVAGLNRTQSYYLYGVAGHSLWRKPLEWMTLSVGQVYTLSNAHFALGTVTANLALGIPVHGLSTGWVGRVLFSGLEWVVYGISARDAIDDETYRRFSHTWRLAFGDIGISKADA